MKIINLPIKEEDIINLKAGEEVYLTGKLYTARDAAHKRLEELIKNKQSLPFDLVGQVIYYVGPTPTRADGSFGSAGPTTASRMDVYSPALLDLGLKGMIGKGYRSDEVKKAIIRNKACYFVALGGAGALLSKCIKSNKLLAFEDLLSEAVYELEVENFPVFVGINCSGDDIYDRD